MEYLSIKNKIVIFDDPLSSFDYSRRNTTIFHLAKIAKECNQFFLLTHDLAFASDFSDKCSFLDQIQLKIYKSKISSEINIHDFNSEFLTATQKDIEVIKSYLNTGVDTEADKKEVIRCIRPALEGVFKSKYFDIISNSIWLGDIIELIKKSSTGHRLYKLNKIIDDVIELNDYTKSHHHSSGNNKNLAIDNDELRRYIDLLMKTIDEI